MQTFFLNEDGCQKRGTDHKKWELENVWDRKKLFGKKGKFKKTL